MQKPIKRLRAAKPSCVYLMQLDLNLFKIGVSIKPERRLKEFKPLYPLAKLLFATDLRDDPYSFEAEIGKRLTQSRVGNELFVGHAAELITLLYSLQDELNATPWWRAEFGRKNEFRSKTPQAVLAWHEAKSRGN